MYNVGIQNKNLYDCNGTDVSVVSSLFLLELRPFPLHFEMITIPDRTIFSSSHIPAGQIMHIIERINLLNPPFLLIYFQYS